LKLSVVTTLYHSAPYIDDFYRRTTETARQLAGDSYEIILVNDGSPDDSLDKAVKLSEQDQHLTVVDLSRNFGHHRAIMTGLSYSTGEYIFLLDSDLEEDPEWLLLFDEQMKTEGCDVVYGIQQKRKGGWFERISGNMFYNTFNALSGFEMPKSWVTARLMTRRYVDALLQHPERELTIGGLYLLAGFEQRPHIIEKHDTSETTYTLSKKIAVFVNEIASVSDKPLVTIFYSGLTIFFSAAIYTFYLVAKWLFFSTPLSGWTSVMASIWLLGGLMISFIGIIGIYLSKVFLESKQRPITIVRQVFRGSKQ
jgi:putative glycosyltransferase